MTAPEGPLSVINQLVQAVIGAETVRLVYSNLKKAGVVSMHDVAPIDVRPGDTPRTSSTLYLWAWCFAEDKPETHLVSRIRRVSPTGNTFDGPEILDLWVAHWPLPEGWKVPRTWG